MKRTIGLILGAGVLSSVVTAKGGYNNFDNDGVDTDHINFGIDEGKQFDSFGSQAYESNNALKSNDDYLGFNNKSSDNVGKYAANCGSDDSIFSTPSITKTNNNVNKLAQIATANDEICGAPAVTSTPIVKAPANDDCGCNTAPVVKAPKVETVIVKQPPVVTSTKVDSNAKTDKKAEKQNVKKTDSAKQVQVKTQSVEAKTNLKNKQNQKAQLQQTVRKVRKDDESTVSSDDAESNHSKKSAAAQAGEHSGSIELIKDVAKEGGMEYLEKHANCGGFKDGEIDTEDIEVKEHVKAIRHNKCGSKVDKKKWLKRKHHKKCFHEKHGNLKKERCVKGSGKDCNKFNLNRCHGNKDEAHKGKESKDMVKVMKDYKMSDLESEVNNAAACAENSNNQEVESKAVKNASAAASKTKVAEKEQKIEAAKNTVVKSTVDNCDN
jgi:hypothetical protein